MLLANLICSPIAAGTEGETWSNRWSDQVCLLKYTFAEFSMNKAVSWSPENSYLVSWERASLQSYFSVQVLSNATVPPYNLLLLLWLVLNSFLFVNNEYSHALVLYITGLFVNFYYLIEKEKIWDNFILVYCGPLTASEMFHQELVVPLFAVGWIHQKKENSFKGINLCKKLQMAVMTICMPYVLDNV